MALSPKETEQINSSLNDRLHEEYKRIAKKVPSLKGVGWDKFCQYMPAAAFAVGHGVGIGTITGVKDGAVVRENTVQLSYVEVPGSNKQHFVFTAQALSVMTNIGKNLSHLGFGSIIPAAIAFGHLKLSGKEAFNKISELAV